MRTITDDEALRLAYDFEGVADTVGAYKRLAAISDRDWDRLNEAEGHLRDQAAILTTWAVGQTIDDATTDLMQIRTAIKDAREATQKIVAIAADVTKVAGVLASVGSLIGLAGAITSGNVPAIGQALVAVGKSTQQLLRAT